ncbi:MAG: DUF1570 domain-containing protein [Kiritimatiellaeota bacterium]|nr:DUF1570 domain-containing protein [Kiritimatiellota bacterium]
MGPRGARFPRLGKVTGCLFQGLEKTAFRFPRFGKTAAARYAPRTFCMKSVCLILLLATLAAVAASAQTNDARLTPAECATWTNLNQRAAASVPSHALWFNDGMGLVGWLRGETNGIVRWEAPFGADGRWQMQFDRADLSQAQMLPQHPPAINYCDVSFQLEFPDLRLIRRPPYSLLTDESPQAAERYLNVLQDLHTNFVTRFGALTEGLGLPDHVQVLLFTDEDVYGAYRKRTVGRRPSTQGFYQPALQRLVVCDQRYNAGLDEILARLAWQSEKAQVQARTDVEADNQKLHFLSLACSAMRTAEAGNLRLLRHEGAHQLFHASGILVDGATPGWLTEGLAQWCETRVPGAVEFELTNRLKEALENNRLIPLADLVAHQDRRGRGFYDGERHVEQAYAEAWSLVRLLLRPAYQEKFFNYLKHLRRLDVTADLRRTPPLDLLCRFLGVTPTELETRWKRSLERLPFDPD